MSYDNFTYHSKSGIYEDCYVIVSKYSHNFRPRVDIISRLEGPIISVTYNALDVELLPNQFILNAIANTENDYRSLKELGIMKTCIKKIVVPSGIYDICEFTEEFLEYMNK